MKKIVNIDVFSTLIIMLIGSRFCWMVKKEVGIRTHRCGKKGWDHKGTVIHSRRGRSGVCTRTVLRGGHRSDQNLLYSKFSFIINKLDCCMSTTYKGKLKIYKDIHKIGPRSLLATSEKKNEDNIFRFILRVRNNTTIIIPIFWKS